MPALPPDSTAAGRLVNPARTLLESPLAAATRGRVYHLRRLPPPRQRGRNVLALAGTLLVHLLFLFGFVLGAAYQPDLPPPAASELLLQVRLIEPPEPPPPPAVHGTPPKQRGPRQQGRRQPALPSREPSANAAVAAEEAPTLPAPRPVPLAAAPTPAAPPAPPAVPALPEPTPLPLPTPLRLPGGVPPRLAVPLPTALPPVPPPLQPEPVRPPQAEGNQPILPPASLALPDTAMPAPANLPAMALQVDTAATIAPLSTTPAPAAPEVPRLQPVPLPALRAPVLAMRPPVLALAPVLIAPAAPAEPATASVAGAEPASTPAEVASVATPPTPLPLAKIALDSLARLPVAPPAAVHPALRSSIAVADVAPAPDTASQTTAPATPASVAAPASATAAAPVEATAAISRAPDASPQGSDTATLAAPVAAASAAAPSPTAAMPRQRATTAKSSGTQHQSLAAGKPGGNQPGALQGAPHGAVGDYLQRTPSGDTEIMRHGAPDIGYRATRFDQDWTPADESSLDTALRRAVEKTTLKHTFHLPRGVRVECAVKPLLPIALFGCRNPDPPPAPVAAGTYAPLHLAPADPLTAPAAAVSSPPVAAPTPMVKADHGAECAAARVAGAPLPPACADELPLPATTPLRLPASSSSSWAPASDQFH